MAAKKKSKKRLTKSRKTASKKTTLRKTAKKKVAKKRTSLKKTALRPSKKRVAAKKAKAPKRQTRQRNRSVDTEAFLPGQLETRSGRLSGDLQGLSNAEGADSESVEELLEEGNAFEADVVAGVEEAGNSDEKEVRTREVPEDDVPEEYLDEE
jgi:hypothetical protein